MSDEGADGPRHERTLPGAGAISWLLRPDQRVRAVAGQLDAVRVLTEAGVLRPSRPDRLVAALLSLVRWGFTPAAGYATSAARYPDEPVAPPSRTGRIVILTSGTTGAPKGASRGGPGGIDPAIAFLSRIPLRARQTTLVAAPLFHAWGFANLLLASLLSTTVVLQRRFDPAATLAALSQHRANALVAVPVM